jgi:leucyl aminopeptidase
MKIELTHLTLAESKANKAKNPSVVVFATSTKKDKKSVVKITHEGLHHRLNESIEDKTIKGSENETILYRDLYFEGARHVIVAGLGDESKMTHETLRQSAAAIYDRVKASNMGHIFVDFDGVPHTAENAASFIQAFTEGLLLASYSFNELKSSASSEKSSLRFELVTQHAQSKNAKTAFQTAHILAESVNFSRRLGDMPGNLMTPVILAKEAIAACKGTGIKATAWDKKRIQREKMGGLLGVNQGSDQEPRFIILEYKGAAASQKPVVFVGKGLTFDCGGISIKPSAGMEEMKYDMCGGANVIGALIAIAKLKLKINAFAVVPATENLVNGKATKPGDVHRARNGKTFEVNNTDAEGRLILADALCYATELKPQAIIDAATLTGAMAMALGNIHTGYFTRYKDLKERVENAAEVSGEWVWNMPLTDLHVKDMKGTYADLSNMSSGKGAGSATAAAFLEQFVGEGIPWAHFDIAGTGWAIGNRVNYCPKKGASGVMIRTFVELARQFQK